MSINFNKKDLQIFVPSLKNLEKALNETTHLCIGAHPDDIEFMAWSGILQCFNSYENNFAAVTVTKGSGSSRTGAYAQTTDEEMEMLRFVEQKKATLLGEYSCLINLGYTSREVRGAQRANLVEDLKLIFQESKAEVVYTHNLADRHDTHVATCLSVIEALRLTDKKYRPKKLYGGEVWRSLDWITGPGRTEVDVSEKSNLTMALMGLYDTQISGGKRYDEATMGRKKSNATYNDAYNPDKSKELELLMDLTPLIEDISLEPKTYLESLINSFMKDTLDRISKF